MNKKEKRRCSDCNEVGFFRPYVTIKGAPILCIKCATKRILGK